MGEFVWISLRKNPYTSLHGQLTAGAGRSWRGRAVLLVEGCGKRLTQNVLRVGECISYVPSRSMNGMLVVYIGFIARVNVIEQILFDIHKPMFVYSICILVYFIPKTTPGLTIKGQRINGRTATQTLTMVAFLPSLTLEYSIVAMVKLG